MMIFRAAWICPISRPPIQDGWVATDHGRIEAIGAAGDAPPAQGQVANLGDVAILPGLVNAHTHLELSNMRGRVPPAPTFHQWITQLFVTRGGRIERADHPTVVDAACDGVREARDFGTALIGDISNSLSSVAPLRNGGLRGLVFHELLGFNLPHGRRVEETRDARRDAAARGGTSVRVSVAPHAPYSVSPELFRAIREEVDRSDVRITSVHVGESDGEVQFLIDGSGPVPTMLRWVGSWRDDWTTPGCEPVEYLDSLGVIDAHTLIVHGVQLRPPSLERLADIGCTLVTCPRSNQWVGVGVPPLEDFFASGLKVAVGTDSLASVDDLNIFSELKTMRWLAPSVSANRLLASATLVGAQALGFDDELGSIDVGKRAELLAVDVPDGITDVEEYLLGGIEARQINWVKA